MTSCIRDLLNNDEFIARHIGPDESEQAKMLATIGINSLPELIEKTVPEAIRQANLDLSATPISESEALAQLKAIANQNKVARSFIGMGYHDTHVPSPILRNLLENPGWYTAYTPYQPEISQGRLEALLNFQQVIIDLTGMEISNASLLDEATAAAEAMTLMKRSNRKKSDTLFVASHCLPQTIDVVKTRAELLDIEVIVDDIANFAQHDVFGAIFQYPGIDGTVADLTTVIAQAHEQDALVSIAVDLLSLVLLKSPGEMGADIVFGSAQRFGVPMGFGGPHAAFLATKDAFKRSMPGRVIGVSKDSHGKPALRMAMQTREQHIRREKATSNICTAQALLAMMAGFYAVYHGPAGLKKIANRIAALTNCFANAIHKQGFTTNASYFDTVIVNTGDQTDSIMAKGAAKLMNFYKMSEGQVSVALNETITPNDLIDLTECFGAELSLEDITNTEAAYGFDAAMLRQDAILTHPVFNSHHSETELMRYMHQLEVKDIALNQSMIPLGSCTMKLNAASEMIPVTWAEFGRIHPFAPSNQVAGYHALLQELVELLSKATGYDTVSLQPNSGAQGEYAGLIAIDKYHKSRGDHERDVCLIPSSAHGTNPASAALAGMKVVIVKCDENGNIDLLDLAEKAEKYAAELSCIMATYPSTHGVFEEHIREVCDIVHKFGGQVYIDGANLNALVGVAPPGTFGGDVSHLNLHKTFCIPHGGGGPGMGPIGVKSHLAPFLPGHTVAPVMGMLEQHGAVSAAPYGSASILVITWMYIKMMGDKGLRDATFNAILNANYIAKRLGEHYPVLYTGKNGTVAHECIIDIRPLKAESGISEEDIAKRLMDFGFHAPTMSFPVAGTLMIEPTESENIEELDRFCDSMIQIRKEISKVQAGEWPLEDNPLVNAPHTADSLLDIEWTHAYSRKEAAYPLNWIKARKYWPSVGRIDNVYGDRNLFCECPPIDSYED
ncbi:MULTISPECIES: aminomethyl-transferring glycine dehydrogenase [Marinomonas]|uniref:Glycine dehydrogenase (decarboxylating) n=1 Tax=Marinomonas arctica TaxID=383750 RepID=A0A7H1JBH1_9GAMM|nr:MULTISPECIES: aminomethyl-transferring glycine dehydrogenase [Marinomonas]MCS7485540.1 glycine dehydrogenase [Marinomonas sp. BSi20414]QNT07837.1 aminomethyl-transferring glycine dehydrogenase [Marinomonas arctica]GGN25835.1 glycine dehydrogenase (decarboxylating) [Marinomonas arctica]